LNNYLAVVVLLEALVSNSRIEIVTVRGWTREREPGIESVRDLEWSLEKKIQGIRVKD